MILLSQVKEEIQLSSLAKMFLRQQIKSECWDSMAVKGKIIKVSESGREVKRKTRQKKAFLMS